MIELNINAKVRNEVLKKPVLAFSDEEISRKHTKTLENLIEYYEGTLEAIGGKEIWEIFEKLAKAEAVLAERRKKIYEKEFKPKYEKQKEIKELKKVCGI